MNLSVNDTQHNSTNSMERHYADCSVFIVILSGIMLRVVMLNAIMLVSWRPVWSGAIPSAHKYETRVG
jgi:hypothetical protein